jgi:hypothetical protein
MIRTDKDHQWASTQMAVHDEPWARETPDDTMIPRKRSATPAKWPLEDRSSDQGRGIEAAHAAIDWDDDKMTTAQAIAWWMPAIVPFAGIVALALVAVYFDQVSAWLLGWL